MTVCNGYTERNTASKIMIGLRPGPSVGRDSSEDSQDSARPRKIKSPGQHRGAVFEAHHGARRFGPESSRQSHDLGIGAGGADESAGTPGSVGRGREAIPGWRSSISGCRCRQPPAVHPQARAGSPRTPAQPRNPGAPEPFDLAPGGVYLAARVTPGAGALLPHRFTLTGVRGHRRSVFCGTVPRVTPGGCYPPPRPVEPGRSSAAPRERNRRDRLADSSVTVSICHSGHPGLPR